MSKGMVFPPYKGGKRASRGKWVLWGVKKILKENGDKFPPYSGLSNNSHKVQKSLKTASRQYFWELTFVNTETGECVIIDSTQIKQKRRWRRFKEFFDKFEGLYRKREVSLFLITLTSPYTVEEAGRIKGKIKEAIKEIKRRFKSRSIGVRGYCWVLEVGGKGGKLHYHVVFATDRVKVREIPEWMKMDKVWGFHTRVEFIRKSVRDYLANYLQKPIPSINGLKSYSVRIYDK